MSPLSLDKVVLNGAMMSNNKFGARKIRNKMSWYSVKKLITIQTKNNMTITGRYFFEGEEREIN